MSAGGSGRAAALGIPASVVPVEAVRRSQQFRCRARARRSKPAARNWWRSPGSCASCRRSSCSGSQAAAEHPSLAAAQVQRTRHPRTRARRPGTRIHGASVHYVTAELDGGPVIMQGRLGFALVTRRDRFQRAFMRSNTSSTPMYVRSSPPDAVECRDRLCVLRRRTPRRPTPRGKRCGCLSIPDAVSLLRVSGVATADPVDLKPFRASLQGGVERHHRGRIRPSNCVALGPIPTPIRL